MKWLLTTAGDCDLDELATELAKLGVSMAEAPPVPLEGGEQVIPADGPPDLLRRLGEAGLKLRAHRNSDIELY